ncbi:hypothetical protein [Streptomyces sp. R08]|uniref:Uncharacterized protein n=1 Tax=Streptomyces sp. R08 TaxID=3238624 RepID=A0AB39MHC1_9ACTN
MRRDYYRANSEYPERQDHFHLSSRYLPSGRVRVTMYEIAGNSRGGTLDKTKVDFDNVLEVLDTAREIDESLRAEGWELWTKPKR